MNVRKQVNLAEYTTFKIGGQAEYFSLCESVDDVREAVAFARDKKLHTQIIGGGSNMLISENGFKGLIMHLDMQGLQKVFEDEVCVRLKLSAGHLWDDFVAQAVGNGWWGVENLSHIPGMVGAACVQNIGAYGQEASESIETVEVLDTKTLENYEMVKEVCNFGYRSSIFNTEGSGKYIILAVSFKLAKTGALNQSYGDVKKYFNERKITQPDLAQVRTAIIKIRDAKFPFPLQAKGGNAGSFFKAPSLSIEQFDKVIARMQKYVGSVYVDKILSLRDRLQVSQGYKVPYGLLIQACGLREERVGGATICPTHAGVILNSTGNATASEVMELFRKVRRVVYQKTGVVLQNEPDLIGFSKEELDYSFALK